MAWDKFEVVSKTKDPTNGNIVATVRFSNSATGETQSRVFPGNDLTDDTLAVWAKTVIATLDARDAAFDALTVGEIQPKDPVASNLQAFQTARNQALALKQLVDIGVTEADADYQTAIAQVRALYDKGFFGLSK